MARTEIESLLRLHSNTAYVQYEGEMIGALSSVSFEIDKDVYYDIIIGSNGMPFGEPIVKKVTFSGSFEKGIFRRGKIDKLLMIDSLGTAQKRSFQVDDNDGRIWKDSDDVSDISKVEITSIDDRPYYNQSNREMVIFPSAFLRLNLFIGFGGVVLKNTKIIVENSNYIKFRSDFIAKYITYYNTEQTT